MRYSRFIKDTNGDGKLDKDDELLGEMGEVEIGVYQMKELLYGKLSGKGNESPDRLRA